ncbi:MAG: MBL fold metallo-hydrolase [Muribaculaceae bacterium]|nr:MBL fold metallo-hydrolase [Muribaculaceae bacterium]
MKVTKFTVNPFGENTFIAWNEDTRHALIVDPGMMQDHERNVVTQFILDNQLVMQWVLLTHIHIDHVTSARWMADRYGIPVAASPADEVLAKHLPMQAAHFRLRVELDPLTIDRPLAHGDTLSLDDETIHVLATPGHTPGGLCFYVPSSSLAFTGDTIFESSIGRTDLPGGDYTTLIDSIKNQILTLPPDTLLISGHGPTTTVANEHQYNPYL